MHKLTDKDALDAALAGKKAVVLFHASWCPFCRSFRQTFAAAATAPFEPVEALLDDEDNPLWDAYGIETVPVVIFFEDGKPLARLDAALAVGIRPQTFARELARMQGAHPAAPLG